MALKAVHVSDIPNLDQVPASRSFQLYSTGFSKGVNLSQVASRTPKFLVIGHRGNGMNASELSDRRMREIKENSISSFNAAAKNPLDFVEFDVQVTKDGFPVIFHDDFIVTEDQGFLSEKRITELRLTEFLGYGPQRDAGKEGKPLLRKNKEGKIVRWEVEEDDSLCTLQEVFKNVEPSVGFNIEIKFDDDVVYQEDHLTGVIQSILQVVFGCAGDRPVVFSTFQPDASILVKKLQKTYPVFFLTDGGNKIYYDVRRNSLDEAVKVCLEGGLDGIVSEAKAVFKNPKMVTKIKKSNLSLLTYGKLNNVAEAVYMQRLMGIEGVIVDFVEEITEAVCGMAKPLAGAATEEGEDEKMLLESEPYFLQRELSSLLKLVPELLYL